MLASHHLPLVSSHRLACSFILAVSFRCLQSNFMLTEIPIFVCVCCIQVILVSLLSPIPPLSCVYQHTSLPCALTLDCRGAQEVVETLRGTGWAQPRFHTDQQDFGLSWYARHRCAAAEVDAEPVPMTLEQRKAELKQRLAKRLTEGAARRNAESAGTSPSPAHSVEEQERERLLLEAKAKKENHFKARRARNRKRRTLKAERLKSGTATAGHASLQG
eukprot:3832693-Pleurochrysis_carterae.AAC.2